MTNAYVESNRKLWDEWTHLHLDTPSTYQPEIETFKAGRTTLDPVELEEVGDVSGKTLLHLMCHFGLDSLSWAREGAVVTGVDFSAEAIKAAEALSQSCGVAANFICADVYHLPECLAGQFDVVYTEGGIIPSLPNLPDWARAIAGALKPGGIFYIHDSHPFQRVVFPTVMDAHGQLAYYHYFSPEPTRIEMRGSYAQTDSDTVYTAYFWAHGIGEIVTALCSAGLRIEFLHEFPKSYANSSIYTHGADGQLEPHVLPGWVIPSWFSLRARLA